jgi:hypothetical protein
MVQTVGPQRGLRPGLAALQCVSIMLPSESVNRLSKGGMLRKERKQKPFKLNKNLKIASGLRLGPEGLGFELGTWSRWMSTSFKLGPHPGNFVDRTGATGSASDVVDDQ